MVKNKLIFWFFGWFLIMILLVFLSQPESRPSKFDTLNFDTTESAELYFKNVRSFFYSMSEEGEGVFNTYRLRAMYSDTAEFGIRFVIYNNWRQNMAFIRIDTNYTDLSHIAYLVSASANGETDSIFTPDLYNESQYDFAKNMYFAARDKNRIGIPHEKDTLWISESQMRSLRTTLRDYFKLVGRM